MQRSGLKMGFIIYKESFIYRSLDNIPTQLVELNKVV